MHRALLGVILLRDQHDRVCIAHQSPLLELSPPSNNDLLPLVRVTTIPTYMQHARRGPCTHRQRGCSSLPLVSSYPTSRGDAFPRSPDVRMRAHRREMLIQGKKALRIFQRPGLALSSNREVMHATSRRPRDAWIFIRREFRRGFTEACFLCFMHAGQRASVVRDLDQRCTHIVPWGVGRCR
jgi:hypothetical protein